MDRPPPDPSPISKGGAALSLCRARRVHDPADADASRGARLVLSGVSRPTDVPLARPRLTAADGDTFPGEGVRVTLACAAEGTARTEISDARGAFRFMNVPVDRCSIDADVQGLRMRPVTAVTVAGEMVEPICMSSLCLRVGPDRTRSSKPARAEDAAQALQVA